MTILLVCAQKIPHTGGLSTHFEMLMGGLEDAGHTVRVVSGTTVQPAKCIELVHLFRCIMHRDSARAARLRSMFRSFVKVLKAELLDIADLTVIHCHDPLSCAAAVAARAKCCPQVPIVNTVHGPWSREVLMNGAARGKPYFNEVQVLERQAFLNADKCIAVDDGQAEILRSDYDLDGNRVCVIMNAINVQRIQQYAKRPNCLNLPSCYFIVPRRLVRKNGVETAIAALGALKRPDVSLVLAGDGPLRQELIGLAGSLGVGKQVLFLGNVERGTLYSAMYRSSGVIVPSVPSHGVVEATSIAALESYACGVPLLASDVGGLSQIVRNAKTGHLFPAGDHEALANLIRRILFSQLSKETIRGECEHAATGFDVGPWIQRVADVYRAAEKVRRLQF